MNFRLKIFKASLKHWLETDPVIHSDSNHPPSHETFQSQRNLKEIYTAAFNAQNMQEVET